LALLKDEGMEKTRKSAWGNPAKEGKPLKWNDF